MGLARLLLEDPGEAEEAVQEAFARLQVARGSLRAPDRAPAYLRATVANLSHGRIRRRQVVRRHPEPPPGVGVPADVVALAGDQRRAVLAAVRALPRRQRECLTLRYYLDLSEREIAGTLGISAGSVKTHASRGLAALAPVLEELR